MTNDDLVALMAATFDSREQSDHDFAAACRDELIRRKPNYKPPT
jgi:hypothetical protein